MPIDTVRKGVALWPGVVGESSATYTISHGITPGVIILTINPQPGPFANEGDMVFEDGVSKIVLKGCKLSAVKRNGSVTGGWADTLEILDRRWKWTLGAISGTFNILDDNKKLLGWSIRSPTELATLCLAAMGETNYSINLPPGINSTQGAISFAVSPPWMGVTPVTGTNPPINWEAEVPANALSQLCNTFGRRVIWQWRKNAVLIDVPGQGAPLPPGSISTESPSIKSAMVPSGIGVIGSPTRYQSRFLLEPVGEEWHGGLVPINQLSYAPLLDARVSIYNILMNPGEGIGVAGLGTQWTISLALAGEEAIDAGAATLFTTNTLVGDTVSSIADRLVALVNGHIFWSGEVTATKEAGTDYVWIKITGKNPNADPSIRNFTCRAIDGPVTFGGTFMSVLFQVGAGQRPGWDFCYPPNGFINSVREVPGTLTKIEAVGLASKSVWKTFRIVANEDGSLPLQVPAYGPLVRRQQIILENTKVQQIVPPTDFFNQFVTDQQLQEQALNFYNGYSHNMPLAVYGSVAVLTTEQLLWPGINPATNTDPDRQILASFSVDPVNQVVYCNDRYCYKDVDGVITDPKLVLETGYTIRNAASNALECFVVTKPFPNLVRAPTGRDSSGLSTGFSTEAASRTNYAFQTHSDVQVGVIGTYANILPRPQAVTIYGTNILQPGGTYKVGLAPSGIYPLTAPAGTPNSKVFEYTTGGGDTFLQVAVDIVFQINSDPVWSMYVVAEALLSGTGDAWIKITSLPTDPPRFLFFVCGVSGPGTWDVRRFWVSITQFGSTVGTGNRMIGYTLLEADPFMRASYYLAGMEAEYFQPSAQTYNYNGLESIDLDGAIQQVTWNVDSDSGCSTTASRNTEHSYYVPPYPARRRIEGLTGLARNIYEASRRGDIGRNLYTPVGGSLSNPYTPVIP